MAPKQPYDISYDQATRKHLRAIEPKYHSIIRAAIEDQLQHEPDKETRNRKPLRQPAPFAATWEIRFGPNNRFRVLYGIDKERRQVQIQAIGVKKGNRLLVAEEEVEL
jgi:mRNA-degrading endonuclease RelE of RelBE toxin-antitoxin system